MAQRENKTLEVSMIVSKQDCCGRQAAFLIRNKCFTFLGPYRLYCAECQDDMLDYENILEAQTKQKIHRTRVFFQLLKLVKKENLKTATALVKEYVKNPEDF